MKRWQCPHGGHVGDYFDLRRRHDLFSTHPGHRQTEYCDWKKDHRRGCVPVWNIVCSTM